MNRIINEEHRYNNVQHAVNQCEKAYSCAYRNENQSAIRLINGISLAKENKTIKNFCHTIIEDLKNNQNKNAMNNINKLSNYIKTNYQEEYNAQKGSSRVYGGKSSNGWYNRKVDKFMGDYFGYVPENRKSRQTLNEDGIRRQGDFYNVINMQDEYPISDAINRLIQGGYLKNTKRALLFMRYLEKIGW